MEITKFTSGQNSLDENTTLRVQEQTWNQLVRDYVLEDEYKELGLDVRDSEMRNLGYLNVEEFKKYLSKSTVKELFDKKYHYIHNKLLDKDNEEFACFELWDKIPLSAHCLPLPYP